MHGSQHRMALGEKRGLTEGEIALARTMFADEIDWPRVLVLQAPRLGFGAMVPLGRTIVFSKWRAARDFAQASLDEQGWYIHEVTRRPPGRPPEEAQAPAQGPDPVDRGPADAGHHRLSRHSRLNNGP
jgi:hypothetical protein